LFYNDRSSVNEDDTEYVVHVKTGAKDYYLDKKFFEDTNVNHGMFFRGSDSWLLPHVTEDVEISTFYIASKDIKKDESKFSLFWQKVGNDDIA